MACLDFGLVVGKLEPIVGRADHAADVAAVAVVGLLIAMVAVHDVAGGDDIGVWEIHAGIAVGVGIIVVGQDRLAATYLEGHRADHIGLLRNGVARLRRHLVAGRGVGGAAEEPETDIVLRHRDSAVLLEVGNAARMVAVVVGYDCIFDRQRRD